MGTVVVPCYKEQKPAEKLLGSLVQSTTDLYLCFLDFFGLGYCDRLGNLSNVLGVFERSGGCSVLSNTAMKNPSIISSGDVLIHLTAGTQVKKQSGTPFTINKEWYHNDTTVNVDLNHENSENFHVYSI